jgi:hypothetical protein
VRAPYARIIHLPCDAAILSFMPLLPYPLPKTAATVEILRSSPFGHSRKFALDILLRYVCRNAWQTVVL